MSTMSHRLTMGPAALLLRIITLGALVASCAPCSYIAVRDPNSLDAARRNYCVGAQTRYYPLLMQPPLCIEGAHAGWKITKYRAEQRGGYDLYAHNPFSTWNQFFNMSDSEINSGRWDRHNDFASPIRDVAVLSFPKQGQTDLNKEVMTPLGDLLVDLPTQQPMPTTCRRLDEPESRPNSFSASPEAKGCGPCINGVQTCCFGDLNCETRKCRPPPPPPPSQIVGAVGFHSGLCSARLPFRTGNPDARGLLENIVAKFWQGFSTADHIDNPVQKYTKAVGVLLQPLDNVQWQIDETGVEPFGGFILTFHYSADVLSVGRDVWGSYQYTFALDGGLLTIVPLEIRLQSSWWDPDTGPLSVISGVRNGLQKTLPEEFRKAALASQAFYPWATLPCGQVSDCRDFVRVLSPLITASAVNAAGFNSTNDNINTLRCSVGDDAACDANGLQHRFDEVWACRPPSATSANPDPESSCALQLRATRLVPHQDEVELVWFDDAEWFSTVFALSIAANREQRAQLCSPPLQISTDGIVPRRTLATVSQP